MSIRKSLLFRTNILEYILGNKASSDLHRTLNEELGIPEVGSDYTVDCINTSTYNSGVYSQKRKLIGVVFGNGGNVNNSEDYYEPNDHDYKLFNMIPIRIVTFSNYKRWSSIARDQYLFTVFKTKASDSNTFTNVSDTLNITDNTYVFCYGKTIDSMRPENKSVNTVEMKTIDSSKINNYKISELLDDTNVASDFSLDSSGSKNISNDQNYSKGYVTKFNIGTTDFTSGNKHPMQDKQLFNYMSIDVNLSGSEIKEYFQLIDGGLHKCLINEIGFIIGTEYNRTINLQGSTTFTYKESKGSELILKSVEPNYIMNDLNINYNKVYKIGT